MKHACLPCRLLAMLLTCLAGLVMATPLLADNLHEESLKSATEALAKDRLEEAIRLNDQVLNAQDSTRAQRATAFSGRCATRYKQSLNQHNPALLPQAISDCDRAVELKSDLQQAYRIRGVALLSAGHADRAAEDLSVALALNPEDVLAFQNRALALAKLGRGREAMAELDAAIRLKPDQPWSYYNRGRLRVAQGDYETSIDDFIAFIRFKRDHEEVYRLRGMSRLLIGLPQQAVGDFHEALRLRPKNNPEALLARGISYFLLERHAEAEQDLAQAMALNPARVETRLWLYLTRLKAGKPARELLTDPVIKRSQQSWPEALVFVLLGDIPAERGLEAARAGNDPVETRLRENLTLLLYGHKARIDGKEADAVRWLESIQAGQEREAPYYRLARQALRHSSFPTAGVTGRNAEKAIAALATQVPSEPPAGAKVEVRPMPAPGGYTLPQSTARTSTGAGSQGSSRGGSSLAAEPGGEPADPSPDGSSESIFADKPIPAPREPLRPRVPGKPGAAVPPPSKTGAGVPSVKSEAGALPPSKPGAESAPRPGKTDIGAASSSKPGAGVPSVKTEAVAAPSAKSAEGSQAPSARVKEGSPVPQAPMVQSVPTFEETRVRVPDAEDERVAMPGAAPNGRVEKKKMALARIANEPDAGQSVASPDKPASRPERELGRTGSSVGARPVAGDESSRAGRSETQGAGDPIRKPIGKSKGGYVFTAASYSTATYANNGLDSFLRLGVPAYVEASQVREKTFHRIMIGPFAEQGEAEEARNRVGEMLKQKPGEISKR
ncbi:MAG: tetratricopeptide repeat protein [Magnetococcales bacterium]|nr:tetratricopeptide repeat protein [Magnetococcales bacterium]